MSEATQVEVIDIQNELAVFDPVADAIRKAKEQNNNLVFDYTDAQGNKAARSHIYELRRLKAPVNEVHKVAKAEAKKFCDALDDKKRQLIDAVNDMIDVHERPIREIKRKKAEEEARIQAEKEAEDRRRQAEIEAREQAIREQEAKLRKQNEDLERKEREESRAAAEAKAKQDLIDAENRRVVDIERQKQRAELEKARMKAEAEEKQCLDHLQLKSEKRERQENEENRNYVHKQIYDALVSKVGLVPSDAKAVGAAIRDRKVPFVEIQY